jgi:alkane 1-monooxygenase
VAAQAGLAIFLLEVINFVEHYGLQRRETSPGRFERVMPWHSWNSSHRVSNWLLINLARHSDHHYLASKRYQVLDHLDAAPQLPAGYGTMFVAALVPPLWRRVMHPRVAAWRARYLAPTAT